MLIEFATLWCVWNVSVLWVFEWICIHSNSNTNSLKCCGLERRPDFQFRWWLRGGGELGLWLERILSEFLSTGSLECVTIFKVYLPVCVCVCVLHLAGCTCCCLLFPSLSLSLFLCWPALECLLSAARQIQQINMQFNCQRICLPVCVCVLPQNVCVCVCQNRRLPRGSLGFSSTAARSFV